MKCLLLIVSIIAKVCAEQTQLLQNFAVGNNQFASDVYQKLIQFKVGSFSVSPLSVETILALFHAGARGETAQQLSTGLHLPEDHETIEKIFTELAPFLRGNQYYTLTCANKIYVNNGFKISNQYKNTAVTVFNAEIQNSDFGKPTQTAREMDRWVAQKTANKITNLVSPSDLSANPSAVLVNAVYFHGKWVKKFRKRDTRKSTFYLSSSTNQIETDMMEMEADFNYYESSELKAKFLEMPYEGSEVTMTFVLPNDKQGLPTLEANIHEILATPKYNNRSVHVVLPKFSLKTTIPFEAILQDLGITKPFSDTADFSGIGVSQQRLKISKVMQKTFIEVNEMGTKAAASTAGSAILLSANYNPPVVKQFIANHSFVYYIKIKDIVLFVGRYSGT